MSTAAIAGNSVQQGLQSYFHSRKTDLQQLGQALTAGDLAGARQDFSAIQNLGANGPFENGKPFALAGRETEFNAIGQALQAGDLAGAKQAFAALQSSFKSGHGVIDPAPAVILNISTQPGTDVPTSSNTANSGANSPPSATAGPEIILNLGGNSGSGSPQEITLSLNNTSSGEQLTIGVGTQQNPYAEQITLNLAQNSNEQIILNLAATPSSTSSAGIVTSATGTTGTSGTTGTTVSTGSAGSSGSTQAKALNVVA